MEYKHSPYFHVGRASDLTGRDRRLYRFLEILPGTLAWGTIVGSIVLSYFAPMYAAIFIIAFDFYWLLKTVYLSMHLRQNWKRLKHNMRLDWQHMLRNVHHDHIVHLVILPFYNEGADIIVKSIESVLASHYDMKKVALVLASEERAGESAAEIAEKMRQEYADRFGYFLVTTHPKDLSGEMAGKGSNISYAAQMARVEILDAQHIPYEHVLVSAFDIDTVIYPQYFLCLTWHFLTAEKPFRSSFQPVPLYNNNIWHAPALSRVVAFSGTFWQMIQQERPEKLSTFSSHAVPFKVLHEIGYWQRNMVSEDSRIFWNAYLAYNGDYRVVPIAYPVSMDANLAPTFLKTMVNIYKQQRRWTWGVENIPYTLFGFIKNKSIPFTKKLRITFMQLEGFWSLATNPLLIFLLGWMPLILGSSEFHRTILSYNLPLITRNLMIFAMSGLILSAVLSFQFLPPMPKHYSSRRRLFFVLQWLLVPITMIVFGSIPGIDAQTRLMLGKYMGFWVTPKHRSDEKDVASGLEKTAYTEIAS